MFDPDLLDDLDHPIRQVGIIDTTLALEGGGAYCGIVIATPMAFDERSRKRLLQKLKNYVDDFYSQESARLRGTPLSGKMRIYVNIHADSDQRIFDLLEDSREWIAERDIHLVVIKNLDPPTTN